MSTVNGAAKCWTWNFQMFWKRDRSASENSTRYSHRNGWQTTLQFWEPNVETWVTRTVGIVEFSHVLDSFQLIVFNLDTDVKFQIPLLRNKSSAPTFGSDGIRSIKISDDMVFMCTSAWNKDEIAIYKLPELTPHSIARVRSMWHTFFRYSSVRFQGHTDGIYDFVWLDNETLLSGETLHCVAVVPTLRFVMSTVRFERFDNEKMEGESRLDRSRLRRSFVEPSDCVRRSVNRKTCHVQQHVQRHVQHVSPSEDDQMHGREQKQKGESCRVSVSVSLISLFPNETRN